MSIIDVALTNKFLLNNLVPRIPESVHRRIGISKAIKAYNMAINIPGYARFLESKGYPPKKINSYNDFQEIPVTDKYSYVKKSKFRDIIYGTINSAYTLERSSGFSGKPHYWPRLKGFNDSFQSYFFSGMERTFSITTKPTLAINTYAMGSWVTGIRLAVGLNNLTYSKKNLLTSMNPGHNLTEIIEIIENFWEDFEQIIIFGYPPFCKEVLEQAPRKSLSKLNFLMGGEGFSEDFRDYFAEKIGCEVEQFTNKILSTYGAADVGITLGYETQQTVLLRRKLRDKPELQAEIFGRKLEYIPNLFQYSPSNAWAEEVNGELVFTAYNGLPVIRYNLHDRGGILPFSKLYELVSSELPKVPADNTITMLQQPVIYTLGRTDGVLQIGGANIYVEQLKQIMSHKSIQDHITGKFFSSLVEDGQANIRLKIQCEVDDNVKADENLVSELQDFICKQLRKINDEYKIVYKQNPEVRKPILELLDSKSFGAIRGDSIKIRYLTE